MQRPVQCLVAAADTTVAEPLDRSVRCSVRSLLLTLLLPSLLIGASYEASDAASCKSERLVQHPVQRPMQCPVTSVNLFLHDLASGLVPIFVLGLCLISWVFSCASKVLLEVFDHRIITLPLSKSRLASY